MLTYLSQLQFAPNRSVIVAAPVPQLGIDHRLNSDGLTCHSMGDNVMNSSAQVCLIKVLQFPFMYKVTSVSTFSPTFFREFVPYIFNTDRFFLSPSICIPP